MKSIFRAAVALSLACCLVACLAGCEDDDTPVDISGSWYVDNYQGQHVTGNFVQSGQSVTGNIGTGSVSGTVKGRYVELTITNQTRAERLVYVQAVLSEDANTMTGDWRMTGAMGSWSATRR